MSELDWIQLANDLALAQIRVNSLLQWGNIRSDYSLRNFRIHRDGKRVHRIDREAARGHGVPLLRQCMENERDRENFSKRRR